jgi:hypothetical protein
MLLACTTTAGALDLTNAWLVTVGGTPACLWTLTQTGTALTMASGAGCPSHGGLASRGTS